MKTKSREYLLSVKKIESNAANSLSDKFVYRLKFKDINIKNEIYAILSKFLRESYRLGVSYGKEVSAKLKEIESSLTKEQLKKYISTDRQVKKPNRIIFERNIVFANMVRSIKIERKRFIGLYDLTVNSLLKNGYSDNEAKNNIDIHKLEHEFVNKVRSLIVNVIFIFAQIGQFDAMKKEL